MVTRRQLLSISCVCWVIHQQLLGYKYISSAQCHNYINYIQGSNGINWSLYILLRDVGNFRPVSVNRSQLRRRRRLVKWTSAGTINDGMTQRNTTFKQRRRAPVKTRRNYPESSRVLLISLPILSKRLNEGGPNQSYRLLADTALNIV